MIRQAPLSFAAVVIGILIPLGIGLWYVIDWGYSREIAALNAQVQTLQIRLDQALELIAELRNGQSK